MRKLSLMAEKFCLEYYSSTSNTEAAIKAGYAPASAGKNADRLMRDPRIQKRLAEIHEKLESEKIAEADEVLRFLTATMRGETQSDTVVVEGIEKGVSEARVIQTGPSDKARVKAAELLAKKYGMLTEKRDVVTTGTVIFADDIPEEGSDGE